MALILANQKEAVEADRLAFAASRGDWTCCGPQSGFRYLSLLHGEYHLGCRILMKIMMELGLARSMRAIGTTGRLLESSH